MADAFLQALNADLKQTQRALSPRCLFCIPQNRALLLGEVITQDVVYTHFFTPVDVDEQKRPLGAYDTLNGKEATIVGSHIHTGKGFRDRRRVRILLLEKRVICHQDVTVLHISRPLEGGIEIPDDLSEIDVVTLRKYTAILRAFPENELAFHQLDATIRQVHNIHSQEIGFKRYKEALPRQLKEEWESAADALIEAGSLNNIETTHNDRSHSLQIEQVVECYLMEKLHDALFSGLVDSCHAQDTKLQEMIYRFRHYTPEDFGLKKGFQCDIVEARDTLRRVTLKKTPLDMLLVLKTSIDQLTKAMMQNVKLRRLDVEAYPLTTDEILDQLLFVLVQVCNQCMQETKAGMASSFPIAAVMEYITKYHFINSNTTALGFTLATFQVAVEYFLMRDVCKEYDLHGETSCSLTIQESKCVQAAHKIRHDLIQAEKKVELARQKSVDDSKQDDFNKTVSNTSDSGRRAYIIGDWSTGNEDIDASKSVNTDGCVPSEVGIHPVKFSIGGKLMSASDSSLTHLSSGQRFFAASTEHGGLFTWGDSSGGRLGFVIADGESRRVTIPRRVSALQQHTIIQVACGGFHSLVTDLNGHVFAWGSNSRGQLGFSFSKTESGAFATPSVVADLRGVYVRSVACGEYHSLALSSDGRVFSWGCNRFGKLGRVAKDLLDMAQPRQVDADWTGWDMDMKTKIESGAQNIAVCRIAAGKDHSLAISGEGVGFTWGRGDSGQLGHGCYMDVSEPKQVMAITPSILDFCKLIDVAGGSNFSLFLSQNGTVFITGSDPSQDVESMYLSPTLLTLPMTLELKYFGRIASISCGEAHYALLSTSGALLLSNSSFFDPSPDAGLATAEVQERRVVWFKEAGIVCRMVCGASHTLVVV